MLNARLFAGYTYIALDSVLRTFLTSVEYFNCYFKLIKRNMKRASSVALRIRHNDTTIGLKDPEAPAE